MHSIVYIIADFLANSYIILIRLCKFSFLSVITFSIYFCYVSHAGRKKKEKNLSKLEISETVSSHIFINNSNSKAR